MTWPVTETTHSLRSVWADLWTSRFRSALNTTWVMPVRSRRSMNITMPWSRRPCTHPCKTTVWPTCVLFNSPHRCVLLFTSRSLSSQRPRPSPTLALVLFRSCPSLTPCRPYGSHRHRFLGQRHPFLHQPAQRIGFAIGQKTEFTRLQIPERQRSHPDPQELDYRMSDHFQHPLDLMFAPFTDRNFQPGIRLDLPDLLDLRRTRHAVFESHTLLQASDLVVSQDTLHLDKVCLGHVIPRVKHRLSELAVVGQEHQPFTVEIQPSGGEHPHRNASQIILDRRPSPRIVQCGNDVLGFVQHQIDERLRRTQVFAVNLDVIPFGIDLGPQFRDRHAVHHDTTGRDQGFSLAPRRQAGSGDQFLQSDFHVSVLLPLNGAR